MNNNKTGKSAYAERKESAPQTRFASLTSPPALDLSQVVAGQRQQQLVGSYLSAELLDLFHTLTGLNLHVLWQRPPDLHLSAAQGLLCPAARAAVALGEELSEACRACLEREWQPSILSGEPERRLPGCCGTKSLVLNVPHPGPVTAFLVLQCGSEAELPQMRLAERLLRLIAHDLEGTLEIEKLRAALAASSNPDQPTQPASNAQVQGLTASAVQTFSRPPASERALPGRHGRQVVQAMLDYVRDHYHKPMALKEVAAHLGMNANYLSGLFHRSTGTTFHRYLDAVRMSKAEELLLDPRARIREVAAAVGYLSPNHFRSVFKACEKVSPSAWTLAQDPSKAEKSGAFLRRPP